MAQGPAENLRSKGDGGVGRTATIRCFLAEGLVLGALGGGEPGGHR